MGICTRVVLHIDWNVFRNGIYDNNYAVWSEAQKSTDNNNNNGVCMLRLSTASVELSYCTTIIIWTEIKKQIQTHKSKRYGKQKRGGQTIIIAV